MALLLRRGQGRLVLAEREAERLVIFRLQGVFFVEWA